MRGFFSAVFVLSFQILFCQELTLGPENKTSLDGYFPEMLSITDSILYAADVYIDAEGLNTSVSIVVDKYNLQDLSKLSQETFEMEDVYYIKSYGELVGFETMFFQNDKLYYLTSSMSKVGKLLKSHLILNQLDINSSLVVKVDTLMINEIQWSSFGGTTSGTAKGERVKGRYTVRLTPDREKILVHHMCAHYKTENIFEALHLYDSNWDLMAEKEIVKPISEKTIPKSFIIDNEGSVYYLQDGYFISLDVNKDYEEWKEDVVLENLESHASLKDFVGGINDEGDLIVTALYVTENIKTAKRGKRNKDTEKGDLKLEGVVFIKIDSFSKEVEYSKLSKFPISFINQFRTNKDIKKGKAGYVGGSFSEFKIFFSDGLTFLVLEQSIDDYLYEGPIVLCFNKEGKLAWSHRIERKVKSFKRVSNYSGFFDEENFHVLINDSEKNYRSGIRVKNSTLEKTKEALPVLCSFNKITGDASYNLKADWNSDKLRFFGYTGIQLEENEPFYFYMRYKKKYKLGRIKF